MSTEHDVRVVRLGKIGKHPNADTLSISHVDGRPVIFRTGDYETGDLAVYVPVDTIVPINDPRWVFLDGHGRIKARRLRGIFSMGLLTPADPEWTEGQDVAALLGTSVYEPPEPGGFKDGESIKDGSGMSHYTDIESWRKWGATVFYPDENVVICEKVHGACSRYTYRDGRLWVGSRKMVQATDGRSVWSDVARRYDLEGILKNWPGYTLYGEVYGQVQDLKYGVPQGEVRFVAFDLQRPDRVYLNHEDAMLFFAANLLPSAPVLYRGPLKDVDLAALAEGKSVLANGACIREGVVIRPAAERYDERLGRTILKLVGEGYLTRKGG